MGKSRWDACYVDFYCGNITNLKAGFRGGDDPSQNIMIYEVDVPLETDRQSFREAL